MSLLEKHQPHVSLRRKRKEAIISKSEHLLINPSLPANRRQDYDPECAGENFVVGVWILSSEVADRIKVTMRLRQTSD